MVDNEDIPEDFAPATHGIAIIGAGNVGATFGYTLVLSGLVGRVALIDIDRDRAEGEAMDIAHAAPLSSPVTVCAGDYAECAHADIVMIAAGVAQREGESRLDLLKRNADVFRDVVPQIVEHNPGAILLIATNPVDIMSYVAWKLSGLPAGRVIGSGTVLDTARLRYLLSRHLAVDPRNIHGYVIGEHGDSEVVTWSRTSVAGIPLNDYCALTTCTVTPDAKARYEAETRNAAYEIIRRKGATHYAVAAVLLRIATSVLLDQRSVLTVSTKVPSAFELGELFLSLPSIVGRRGIERVLELPLADGEHESLRHSAELLTEALDGLGTIP
jgi:L-lactate dehydrogenase